ncbi:TAXI family TRAP transporter solute-binding subunit (plasmid) [Paracoccus sp. TK19116]|uniref:TAXI family TRAP transporter solute-binding subunit n=1 Tax=Paracoccus albicereus TaxID=2922394 RepID=A0ABT1MLG2_9RHOB|nr:TAXI family TRAP transporter solute-binding subunit [Paracoccus albicereus]MCQ0969130.1 TAXI family TRAP transporter solute-binding subunit [Paracoccus albicereus]
MIALPIARACAVLFAALSFVAPPGKAVAQEAQMSIMTGSPSGTYIQFGRDLSGLMETCGQTMEVVESAGSLENFLAVRQRPNTQFGIVQSDVLEYMRTFAAEDQAIARAVAGVRIAVPLYDEELHILAKADIETLGDLAGKRVAIGVENSGTYLTSSLILSLAGIEPAERVLLNPAEALPQLQDGQIDALVYVAGAPATLFQDESIDGDTLHLVPITDEVLRSVYSWSTIPEGTYAFQTGPLDTVAVKAVLMTYDYQPRRNAYHRSSCAAVSEMSHQILTRLDQLKESGHPKWKSVDLADVPPGWDIGQCVNAGIAPDYVSNCTPPATATTTPAPESEANSAYRRNICAVMGC